MAQSNLLPEEKARVKIDRQLTNAGWDIVSRNEYVPRSASAVKEALMQGNTVPSPKKQTKNVREKPNEKNDKYNIKLLYPTAFIPRFA